MNTTSTTLNHRARTSALVGLAVLALAACGSSTGNAADDVAPAPLEQPPAEPAPTAPPRTGASAKSANTALGGVLTDADGLTLYGFTNDIDATSTCYGTCADAWPPVIVPTDFTVGPGLDVGFFATTERDDGQLQLVAGKFPLYRFDGDAVPGDISGHGSGDVWFAIDTDGALYELDAPTDNGVAVDAADADTPAIVSAGETELGEVLVDATGLSLYGFTNDTDGSPSCADACADAWPPVIVASTDVPAGLDPEVFSVVERVDGTLQLKAGAWPLYLFAGDAAPGDINGQGSGDVWFLTAPDGSLVTD
ncbi:MAG: hypothetical protein WA964_01855 [Ilumatobacter sp.]|uniref:hypothetical protein n=1 Tax=Ilumatobacter sp. TaxID=1967498 RepID=UPI003C76E1DD